MYLQAMWGLIHYTQAQCVIIYTSAQWVGNKDTLEQQHFLLVYMCFAKIYMIMQGNGESECVGHFFYFISPPKYMKLTFISQN